MNKLFWNFATVFCVLFILTFEFEYSIFPEFYQLLNPFFEELVQFSGLYFFSHTLEFDSAISSDSIGLYFHLFNLFWISLIISLALKVILKHKEVNLRPYLLILLSYYLALQLLIYGFDKLFKTQFFFPEPNTLFTPLKDLSKDILYWSTIGMSRSYCLFLGGIEILVAVFLLIKKTRLLGAVLGFGVMLNVVAVNFSFDISVKMYSLFLLMSFVLILSPYVKCLYAVFISGEVIQKPKTEHPFLGKFQSKKWIIKSVVILLFLTEGLFPYVKMGIYNDDTVARPKFHGAYSVGENKLGIKRVFVHRHGYLIFQNGEDKFQDFQLEINEKEKKMILTDYRTNQEFALNCQFDEDKLTRISGVFFQQELNLTIQKIELSDARKVNSIFNWIAQ